jgi:hypothetical protein
MKKRSKIQKSIYNTDKTDFLILSKESFRLSAIKKERKSIFTDLSYFLSSCTLDFSLDKDPLDLDSLLVESFKKNEFNWSIENLAYFKTAVPASCDLDCYLKSVPNPVKANGVTEITEQLRKLNIQFKHAPCLILYSQIKKLVTELRGLLNKQFFKQKNYVKNLQKYIYGLFNIDYRKRFRILVRNLYNCFSDCSKSDEDDISIVQNNYGNLLFNITFNTHVQQKTNYSGNRKFYQ